MSFGLDSALLIALTTSAVAWAKRGDVVEDHVFRVVRFVSGDDAAARVAAQVGQRFRTPSLLLKGFNVQSSAGPTVPHRTGAVRQSAPAYRSLAQHRTAVRNNQPELLSILRSLDESDQWATALALFRHTERCDTVVHKSVLRDAAFHVQHMLLGSGRGGCREAADIALSWNVLPSSRDAVVELLANVPYTPSNVGRLSALVASHPLSDDLYVTSALLTCACSNGAWPIAQQMFRQLSETTAAGKPFAIRNVFHLCFPASCVHGDDAGAEEVLREAHEREPEAVVEVLMRACCTPLGAAIAGRYAGVVDGTAWSVAIELFGRQSTARNANSLVEILPVDDNLSLRVDNALRKTDVLSVPDAVLLSKTISRKQCWRSALAAASVMARYPVALSSLAAPLAANHRWSEALNMVTNSIAKRKIGKPSTHELAFCVFASFATGRSAAGSFWMDRAHAQRVVLPREVYDEAIVHASRSSWVSAIQILCKARQLGTPCGKDGVSALITAAARDKATPVVLDAIWATGSARWVP